MKLPTQHRAIITISRPAPCVIIEIIAHNELPSSISISTFCRLYFLYQLLSVCILTMAIRVVEVSSGGTTFERFLPKNHQTQRKLLNFENWTYGEVSKSAKSPNLPTFKVNFLHQKLSESFSIFFSLKNINLGAHFLLLTFFDSINF